MNETNEQGIAQQEPKSPVLVDKNVISKTDVNSSNVPSFNSINLFDEKQLAAAENFLMKVMRSEKGGIKNVNDGLAVLMRAQDLNLPFSTCIEHIHVINGKTGLDIHIIKALLSRAGCTWRCLKDYQPQYEYTDGINVYVDGLLPEYCVRCNNATIAAEKAAKDLILKTDKKRANYYNFYSNKKWGAASSYHLTVDSSILGIDKTVEFIKNYIDAKENR